MKRLLLATAALAFASPALAEEVNLLAWCDHDDPALLAPFTQATGIEVNVKVYELTGAAISILEQSQRGDWDVFMVDTADVRRLAKQGMFAPLDPATLPIADVFPGALLDGHHVMDGVRYAVPEKFGFNTVAYDSRVLGIDGAVALKDLFDPKLKGRVAVYDYYWPIILQLGQMRGIEPADFGLDDLPTIRDDLFALKAQASIVGDIVSTQTALNAGDSDVVIGQAEWVAAVKDELPHLNWTIQEEGGIWWSESLALFADSARKDAGLKLIQYLMSPEGQARLATAECYWGFPANSAATLDDTQKANLRFAEVDTFLANARPFPPYDEALDAAMIALWTEFLAQ
jgi:spermidine/putrescine transport system substrate-binding protein